MPAQPEFQRRLQSIERLLGEIQLTADPSLRATVQELVQLVMDLHGAGLERLLELVREHGAGDHAVQRIGEDELVSSLLVLYGIHPLDMETRIAQALEKVRLRLRALDAEVQLLGIQDGSVRIRVSANGHGCGSNPQQFKELVENAVYQAAPDLVELTIEAVDSKQGFVPLEMLQGSRSSNGHKGAL